MRWEKEHQMNDRKSWSSQSRIRLVECLMVKLKCILSLLLLVLHNVAKEENDDQIRYHLVSNVTTVLLSYRTILLLYMLINQAISVLAQSLKSRKVGLG